MPLNRPPLGFTGEEVHNSPNPTVKPGLVRFANATELAATTNVRPDVALSPASLKTGTLPASFQKVNIPTGNANSAAGFTTLVAGVSPAIATTAVTAASIILISRQSKGAGSTALGELTVTARTAGTSFVISALSVTDTTVVTGDASILGWQIIN